MIAVLKNGTTPSQIQHLVDWLKNMNLDVHISEGSEVTILGLVGDTSRVDIDLLKSLEMVETVKRVSEPFKQANRKFHPKDTIIEAGKCPHRRRVFCHDRRPVLAWNPRSRSLPSPQPVKEAGAIHSPGRRVQAPHLPLRLSGPAGRGHPAASGGQKGHGAAHRHGDHEHFHPRSVRRRGYHSGRCAEYAELSTC